jgi:hypothetical protein
MMTPFLIDLKRGKNFSDVGYYNGRRMDCQEYPAKREKKDAKKGGQKRFSGFAFCVKNILTLNFQIIRLPEFKLSRLNQAETDNLHDI